MRNLIKNNYHRHSKKRVPFDEKTLKDFLLFYDRLGLSKKESSERKWHIINWLKKKIKIHDPKTLPFFPFFSDEYLLKVLPDKLSERVYVAKDSEYFKKTGREYYVRLTKQCIEALPIKPGIDCKFIGKSPFLPSR